MVRFSVGIASWEVVNEGAKLHFGKLPAITCLGRTRTAATSVWMSAYAVRHSVIGQSAYRSRGQVRFSWKPKLQTLKTSGTWYTKSRVSNCFKKENWTDPSSRSSAQRQKREPRNSGFCYCYQALPTHSSPFRPSPLPTRPPAHRTRPFCGESGKMCSKIALRRATAWSSSNHRPNPVERVAASARWHACVSCGRERPITTRRVLTDDRLRDHGRRAWRDSRALTPTTRRRRVVLTRISSASVRRADIGSVRVNRARCWVRSDCGRHPPVPLHDYLRTTVAPKATAMSTVSIGAHAGRRHRPQQDRARCRHSTADYRPPRARQYIL